MKSLKNIWFGFLVSYIGSVPLGYLNVLGFEIYSTSGMSRLIPYLLGVLCIEALVIYGTFVFASGLAQNRKVIKYIDFFSIFFMLVLAYFFYHSASETFSGQSVMSAYVSFPTFIIGIILSCLNFIQIPFWVSWNLYLVGNGYVSAVKSNRYVYIFGTLAGTFCGMLTLVLCLDFITGHAGVWRKYIMSHIIPALFLALALFQAFKFWRNYYRINAAKN